MGVKGVVFVILLLHFIKCQTYDAEIVQSWKYLDFNFKTIEERSTYLNKKHYEHCAISGIKLDNKGDIYVSIPRIKADVPVTLAKLVNGTLEAFPSWDMNDLENTTLSLKSVRGFEIDGKNRMWIVDQGRVENKRISDAQIIVYDLESNAVLYQHTFTEEEAPKETALLHDITVSTGDDIGYISDAGLPVEGSTAQPLPGILFVDIDSQVIRRHLDNHTSTRVDPTIHISVQGKMCLKDAPLQLGASALALSCDGQRLYWSPLTSHHVFGIETDILRMYKSSDSVVTDSVVDMGITYSATSAMMSSTKRDLFMTGVESNALFHVNEKELAPYMEHNTRVEQQVPTLSPFMNQSQFLWPDALSISDGYLYMTSNNWCEFIQGNLDFGVDNFFIFRIKLTNEANSYASGCDVLATNFGAVEIVLMSSGAAFFLVSLVIVLVISVRKRRGGHYDVLH